VAVLLATLHWTPVLRIVEPVDRILQRSPTKTLGDKLPEVVNELAVSPSILSPRNNAFDRHSSIRFAHDWVLNDAELEQRQPLQRATVLSETL